MKNEMRYQNFPMFIGDQVETALMATRVANRIFQEISFNSELLSEKQKNIIKSWIDLTGDLMAQLYRSIDRFEQSLD